MTKRAAPSSADTLSCTPATWYVAAVHRSSARAASIVSRVCGWLSCVRVDPQPRRQRPAGRAPTRVPPCGCAGECVSARVDGRVPWWGFSCAGTGRTRVCVSTCLLCGCLQLPNGTIVDVYTTHLSLSMAARERTVLEIWDFVKSSRRGAVQVADCWGLDALRVLSPSTLHSRCSRWQRVLC
jgi:hypothetical protein